MEPRTRDDVEPAMDPIDPTDPTERARRLRGHPTRRSPTPPRIERQIVAVLERLDAMRARRDTPITGSQRARADV